MVRTKPRILLPSAIPPCRELQLENYRNSPFHENLTLWAGEGGHESRCFLFQISVSSIIMTDGDGIGLGLHLLDSPEYISRGSRSDSSLSEIGFDADDLSRLRNLDSPDPPASEVHRLQCELPYLARDHANALLDLLKAGKVFRNPGASAARVAGPRRVKAVLRAAEHATIVCGPMDSRALMFLIGALDLAVDDVIGPTDALTEMRAAGDRVVARVDLRTLKAPFAAAEAAVQHIDGPLRRYAVGGWFATEHDVRAACDGAPPFHAVHSLVCHLPSRAGGGLPLGPLATTLFRSAVAGGCRPGRALVYARSALRGLGEQVSVLYTCRLLWFVI